MRHFGRFIWLGAIFLTQLSVVDTRKEKVTFPETWGHGELRMDGNPLIKINSPGGKIVLQQSGNANARYWLRGDAASRDCVVVDVEVDEAEVGIKVCSNSQERSNRRLKAAISDADLLEDCEVTVAVPVESKVVVYSPASDVALGSLKGRVKLNGGTGKLIINNFIGILDAYSDRGDIKIAQSQGKINLESVEGDIVATDCGGISFAAKTGGGDIRYFNRQPVGYGEEVTCSSSSGDINYCLPSTSFAVISWTTKSGDCGIPVGLRCDYLDKRRGQFTLNRKGAKVRLHSDYGYIRVGAY